MGDPREQIPGYQLIEPVGQGGFAVVYRALHERVGRVVAVKILSVADVDERALRNFRRELEVMGRLSDHPNIVAALDTGTTAAGRPYIVMDFHEGGSLHSRAGALPPHEVLRIGVKVAGALAAVHDAGVFHGDIKPQNILVSKYGEPALADFGVARMLDVGQLSSNTLTFTPHHAAPEVLNGSPQNVRSDVYALGSTLYQLLAGRPAYHDPADAGVAPLLLRVLRQPLPPLPEHAVPAPLRALVERAMSKDPGGRPQDAWAFVRELQQVQRALALPVTEPATAVPPPAPAPPHPVGPTPQTLGPTPHGPPPPGPQTPVSAPHVPGSAPQAPGSGPVPGMPGPPSYAHQDQPLHTRPSRRSSRRWVVAGAAVVTASAAAVAAVHLTGGFAPATAVPTATVTPGALAVATATEPVVPASSSASSEPSAKAGKPTLAKVSLSTDAKVHAPGQTFRLKVTGRLSNGRPARLARADLDFHSADPRVATVSPDGQVTVLKEGRVRITVKVTMNGSAKVAALPLTVGSKATPEPEAEPESGPRTLRVPATLTNMVRGGGYSAKSFPACQVCKVKNGNPGFYRETYFRFDLSRVKVKPDRIASVVLHAHMRVDDSVDTQGAAMAYAMGNGWNAGVTFDTRPQLGAQLGEFPAVGVNGAWVKLNLTGYFRPKVGGPASVGLAESGGVGTAIGGLGSGTVPYLVITTR
ncbi:protein kinase domain-containing protein [Nonomuraea ceibae]|uniref:protein kinase domain-containing protein n=1 Tax=Nonomuraea ceibae TaxID=1935170 RepID=UPI001FED0D2E|nr:protein kinase [Nonomuraea ceibae]